MNCSNCGITLPVVARFCPNCGTVVAAPPPPPPATPTPPPPAPAAPTNCPSCGAAVAPHERFCSNCGFSLAAQPAAAAPPAPVRPSASAATRAAGSAFSLQSFQPLEWGIIAGLVVAALGTFLQWVTYFGDGVSAWNTEGDGRFQVADWTVGAFPLDALLVVLLAAAGIACFAGPIFRANLPDIPYAEVIAGVAIVVIGLVNYLYVNDLSEDVNAGIGLYLAILGGAAAAVCGFMVRQEKAG